ARLWRAADSASTPCREFSFDNEDHHNPTFCKGQQQSSKAQKRSHQKRPEHLVSSNPVRLNTEATEALTPRNEYFPHELQLKFLPATAVIQIIPLLQLAAAHG
ncbi:hypothetical protein, partial [Paraburkholderia sp.]|uniref:hypothetical protein n=1 Tax=Paraburkholderia sp. TaxID=1926495 RepID=UPI0039E3EABE